MNILLSATPTAVSVTLTWVDYLTLAVAFIALIQPWIIKFYKAYNMRITIIPNKHFIHRFTNYGLSVEMYLTLVSKYVENIVSSVNISIEKEGNEIYSFDWSLFETPYN